MSKQTQKKSRQKFFGYDFIKKAGEIEEYRLKSNGLGVLFLNRPGTGVVTTNITYLVGARDEVHGETGVAHMLEHMLFKPTQSDLKRKEKESASMKFERETGCVLNANTWKDRTTYYFCYPNKYFSEALQIEAERMTGTILTQKELAPEQGNVLSEFDMYNGDPYFALHVQMCSTAFHSHPYGHETIGYREDIEEYTSLKLREFYRNYYRPDNAVMMVIGDVDKDTALEKIKEKFGKIKNPTTPIPRLNIREPRQEGIRRTTIERSSSNNIVSIGFKHGGFPSEDWFVTSVMLDVLSSGSESILHKLLVDTGKASGIESMIEPTSEVNIGSISIALAKGVKHQEVENLVLATIKSLNVKSIKDLLEKTKEKIITEEVFARDKSMRIAAELTEYTAAESWETYTKVPQILSDITTKKVLSFMQKSFVDNNLTIGYFVGKGN